MANDNTGLIVGGILAVGGIGFGLYEWYRSGEKAKAAKEAIDAANAYMAKADELNTTQDQLILELHQIITKFNNATANGGQVTPEQEADIEAEKQNAIDLEARCLELEKELADLKLKYDAAVDKSGQPGPGLPDIVSTVQKFVLQGFLIAAEVVAMGLTLYTVGKYVKHTIDRWTKGGGTGGASGTTGAHCPVDGAPISGNTTDQVKANMDAHFHAYHPVVNVNAMVAALPDARAKFGELPLWVQDSIAADAGILEWYQYPDWSPYLRQSPSSLFAIMVSLAVLGACFLIALPLLPAAVGTAPEAMAGMAYILVPAF